MSEASTSLGKQQLIHLELQSTNDPGMGDRMVLYHVLARTQYNLPVLSCVIYLRQEVRRFGVHRIAP
jgi:hypothetical protein